MPDNIGVLGGTFDPVHRGHLHLAIKTQMAFRLARIYFVVAQTPPHKVNNEISNVYHRFAMVCLALSPYPTFFTSSVELELGASPYTIDTLDVLSRRLRIPPHSMFFIAGGDSFECIQTWKNYQELLTEYNVLFVERHGSQIDGQKLPQEIRERVLDLRPEGVHFQPPSVVQKGEQDKSKVFLLDVGAPPISSTAIRGSRDPDSDPSDKVPKIVACYIKKHQLYRS